MAGRHRARFTRIQIAAAMLGVMAVAVTVAVAGVSAQSEAVAASTSKPLYKGINAHPMWFGADKVDPLINDAKAAGVKTIRADWNWSAFETSKGVHNATPQSNMDYFVSKATAAGIEVLPVVTGAPGWANGGQSGTTPPTNMADYANFVQYIIQRYPAIKAVEVWNEPDGSWAWSQSGTDAQRAAKYVSMLKTTYNRVKSVRPEVKVIGPTLSNYTTTPASWLKAFYTAGGKPYKDVGSYHFYGDPPQHGNLTPEALVTAWKNNIWPIITANGDGGQELWVTETGYNTAPAGVSESTQASYLTRMYSTVLAQIPTATRLYWYSMSNDTDGSTNPEANYGIEHYASSGTGASAHFNPKPAYTAMKNVPTPQ